MRLAVAVSLLLLTGCPNGCDSPVGPDNDYPTPTPTPAPSVETLTFVNGLSGSPIQGIEVHVDGTQVVDENGNPVTTDEAGNISATVRLGSDISAMRTGYLTRDTRYEYDLFSMWPSSNPEYERKIVYHPGAHDDRLIRPNPGDTFTYSVADNISSDSEALGFVLRSTQEVEISTEGRIKFSQISQGGDVEFLIDPNNPDVAGYAAVIYLQMNGYEVIGGRIVFSEMQWVKTNTILHELGHFLGFGHSDDPYDLMCPGNRRIDHKTLKFSHHEFETWVMMAKRMQGQQFPDNDRNVSVSSSGHGSSTMIVKCKGK
jgi:hypothetical protein